MDQRVLDFLSAAIATSEAAVCQQLREPFRELRRAYQRGRVTAEYDRQEIVAAYLLGYYPGYVELTRWLVGEAQRVGMSFPAARNVGVLAVCAGPCPEVYAIAKRLADTAPAPFDLHVCTYDLHSRAWQPGRTLTETLIGQDAANARTAFCPHAGDVAGLDGDRCREAYDIVVAQNCLNELAAAEQLLRHLCERVAPGGWLLVADQANYYGAEAAFGALDAASAHAGLQFRAGAAKVEVSIRRVIPPLVRDTFYDGEPEFVNGAWRDGQFDTRKLDVAWRVLSRPA